MKRKTCEVEWISGFLEGFTIYEDVFDPRVGDVISPYGCSGSYRIKRIIGPCEIYMKKDRVIIGHKYFHKGLNQSCVFCDQCKRLEEKNSDTTSIFMSFDGDIKEVSLGLIIDVHV